MDDPLKNWTRLQNEECLICMLPVPIERYENIYCVTCGKTFCIGCVASVGIAHVMDGADAKTANEKATTCPFCRSDTEDNDDKYVLEQEMKRANAGNSESMNRVGSYYFFGQKCVQQDKAEGLKWLYRAVEAGNGHAAYSIGTLYHEGDGVDQYIDKALEYFQKAGELGYIPAFVLIGKLLLDKGDIEEGTLSVRKAAMCGMSFLFRALRDGFKDGFITKEEYAFTLRENQTASNEMKSEGREWWKSTIAMGSGEEQG